MAVSETDSIMRVQVAVNRPTFQSGAVATPTGILSEVHVASLLTTSGFSVGGRSNVSQAAVPVSEKDTIYLHGVADLASTNGLTASALIFIDEQ